MREHDIAEVAVSSPVRSAISINDLRQSHPQVTQLFFGGTQNQAHFEVPRAVTKAHFLVLAAAPCWRLRLRSPSCWARPWTPHEIKVVAVRY